MPEQWLTAAAERGNARVQATLASMFAAGLGVRQSHAAAVRWYRRAGNQGHPTAQLRLAEMFAEAGEDRVEAYFWASLAEFGGQPGAHPLRTSIEALMSADELAAARARAQAWQPTRR